MKEQVLSNLPDSFPWINQIHYFDCINSTNTQAKAMAAEGASHGTVLIADRQTDGRGRMGRSFHSPANMGIYLSIILRPDTKPTQLMHLTCATGVAACNAIEVACGFRPKIKWANDLIYQKKKLGGILTELSLNSKTGLVDYAIIGIGINCNQSPTDFPEDIREIATSLSVARAKHVDRPALIANLLCEIENMSNMLLPQKNVIMAQYRKDCFTIGEEISVVKCDCVRHGRALDIDDDGALIVSFPSGTVETVNTGEVSIRGMYGYL